MSEWSVIVKNNKNKKIVKDSPLKTKVSEETKKTPMTDKETKEINELFEDEYGDKIEQFIKDIYYDIKPTTNLLDNISCVDIEYFFYDFIDKESSVKLPEKEPEVIEDYYDEEYY